MRHTQAHTYTRAQTRLRLYRSVRLQENCNGNRSMGDDGENIRLDEYESFLHCKIQLESQLLEEKSEYILSFSA